MISIAVESQIIYTKKSIFYSLSGSLLLNGDCLSTLSKRLSLRSGVLLCGGGLVGHDFLSDQKSKLE